MTGAMDLMLDDDVLELVLRHLDLFHLPAAASVARRWNAIVDGTHVASGTWFCGSDYQLRGMRRLVRRKMAEDSHASRTWLRPLLYDVNNARVDTEEDPFVFHFDPSSPLTSVRMVNELMMRKRTESSHSPIQPSSTAARASRTHTDEPRFPALSFSLSAEATARCNTKRKALSRVANVLGEFEKMCSCQGDRTTDRADAAASTMPASTTIVQADHAESMQDIDLMYGSVLAPAVCTAIHQNGREPHDQGNKEQEAEERRVLVAAEALALTLTHYAPLLLVRGAEYLFSQRHSP